jgi:hypothetical protein
MYERTESKVGITLQSGLPVHVTFKASQDFGAVYEKEKALDTANQPLRVSHNLMNPASCIFRRHPKSLPGIKFCLPRTQALLAGQVNQEDQVKVGLPFNYGTAWQVVSDLFH